MRFSSIILFVLLLSTSFESKACSGFLDILVFKREPPFGIKHKRKITIQDDRLVYCKQEINKNYTETGDTPFQMIKNIRINDNGHIRLELSTKDEDQTKLYFSPEPDGSEIKDIKDFFTLLDEKLKSRRSWQELEKKLDPKFYSIDFIKLVERLKEAEKNNQIILTPTSKGLTGAKIISIIEPNEDTEEKKAVGIFKGSCDDPLAKKLMGQASILLSSRDKLSKARAEVLAYQIARNFEFNGYETTCLVPEAVMLSLNGEWGVFIRFLEDYKEPKEDEIPFNEANNKELYNFQLLAIYDFLIGNLDRHQDNLFIKKSEHPNYEDLKLIDQGNSFPFMSPPAASLVGRNMYLWAKYPAAQKEFLPEIKFFIKHFLNQQNFAEFMQMILSESSQNLFLAHSEQEKKALEYLELRRLFLYEVIAKKSCPLKPCDLINYKRADQIEKTLIK